MIHTSLMILNPLMNNKANSRFHYGTVTSEVFDYSISDSITDIRESAAMDENEIKSILSDNEKLESINPESTRLKSTVNPTRPKEHASAATKESEEGKRESENKGSHHFDSHKNFLVN
jgi:hypothetical protein